MKKEKLQYSMMINKDKECQFKQELYELANKYEVLLNDKNIINLDNDVFSHNINPYGINIKAEVYDIIPFLNNITLPAPPKDYRYSLSMIHEHVPNPRWQVGLVQNNTDNEGNK